MHHFFILARNLWHNKHLWRWATFLCTIIYPCLDTVWFWGEVVQEQCCQVHQTQNNFSVLCCLWTEHTRTFATLTSAHLDASKHFCLPPFFSCLPCAQKHTMLWYSRFLHQYCFSADQSSSFNTFPGNKKHVYRALTGEGSTYTPACLLAFSSFRL